MNSADFQECPHMSKFNIQGFLKLRHDFGFGSLNAVDVMECNGESFLSIDEVKTIKVCKKIPFISNNLE